MISLSLTETIDVAQSLFHGERAMYLELLLHSDNLVATVIPVGLKSQ